MSKCNVLSRSDGVRDLGVVFDKKLSFVPHITQLISSAAKIYGFVIRNGKYFNNSSTYIGLFNTMEYGSMIWQPIYTCHQRHLEAIQRRFLKFLVWREDKVYLQRGVNRNELLSRFSLISL
ncbi:hypothetical protein WA026_000217 [Henosepilachna vigintioctopunctata]|uniref:Uncharacterized protein n=1 Tax=Henosepilachna vigintioctopunctata TaxID=420089 RepID=A0AAW1UXQ9_9CUCU